MIFHNALNEIRFPGIYVPSAIESNLVNLRKDFISLKQDIFDTGGEPDSENKTTRLEKIESDFGILEKKCCALIVDWKNNLLNPQGILVALLSDDG